MTKKNAEVFSQADAKQGIAVPPVALWTKKFIFLFVWYFAHLIVPLYR